MARPRRTIFYPTRPRGAPIGNRNRLVHGRYSKLVRSERDETVYEHHWRVSALFALIKEMRLQAEIQGVGLADLVLDKTREVYVKRPYGVRRRGIR